MSTSFRLGILSSAVTWSLPGGRSVARRRGAVSMTHHNLPCKHPLCLAVRAIPDSDSYAQPWMALTGRERGYLHGALHAYHTYCTTHSGYTSAWRSATSCLKIDQPVGPVLAALNPSLHFHITKPSGVESQLHNYRLPHKNINKICLERHIKYRHFMIETVETFFFERRQWSKYLPSVLDLDVVRPYIKLGCPLLKKWEAPC